LGIDKNIAWANYPWDDSTSDFSSEFPKIFDKHIRNKNNKAGLTELSTEVCSLSKLGLESGDVVVILASDTAQGRVCSEAIKRCIILGLGLSDSAVKIEHIEGLNTYDHEKFRVVGLKNLISKTIELIDNYSNYELFINPVGGYKNILPFMTIIGMVYGKKVIHWYEITRQIVILPPMPITFDTEIFNRAFDALKYVEEKTYVHKSEYLYRIKDYEAVEEDLFLSYVENIDDTGNITVSPLAFTLLKIENERRPVKILADLCDSLRKDTTPAVQSIKQHLSEKLSSPLWRRNHMHPFIGTDLTVFKTGNNPVRRIAGFMLNDTDFGVTHCFTNHYEYERVLNVDKIAKFANRTFVDWQAEY
jgi:putative CRISPR-associated protein (TIGR02619 family)